MRWVYYRSVCKATAVPEELPNGTYEIADGHQESFCIRNCKICDERIEHGALHACRELSLHAPRLPNTPFSHLAFQEAPPWSRRGAISAE
jgi:hypothetical protein